jgi:hypothetical protein
VGRAHPVRRMPRVGGFASVAGAGAGAAAPSTTDRARYQGERVHFLEKERR